MLDEQFLTNKERTIDYLKRHYKLCDSTKLGDYDLKFIELFASKICKDLLEKSKLGEYRQLSKDISKNIAEYEQLFFDEVILEVQKLNLPRKNKTSEVLADKSSAKKEGEPDLNDYIEGYGKTMCLELLRKRYFYKDWMKGGVTRTVCEKILKKYGNEIEVSVFSVKKRVRSRVSPETYEIFLEAIKKWEEREHFQTEVQKLSKEKIISIKEFLKDKAKQYNQLKQLYYTLNLDSDDGVLSYVYYECDKDQQNEMMESLKTKLHIEEHQKQEENALKLIQGEVKKHVKDSSKYYDIIDALYKKPDITEIRQKVLKEMNLLDHNLNTLVELYNILEESENDERKDDLYKLIRSIIREYREVETTLDSKETIALIPIASINNKDVFRMFLETFLEDFDDDILFEPKKAKMLSVILLAALRSGPEKSFIDDSDLISCLKILQAKLKNLALDPKNSSLLKAIDSLNDILFIMTFLGVKGVKEADKKAVEEFISFFNSKDCISFFKKLVGKNEQSEVLDIKLDYAKEALKRIKGTIAEEAAENYTKYLKYAKFVTSVAKGCLGDIKSFHEAIVDLKEILIEAYKEHPSDWYEKVNMLRILYTSPITDIQKKLSEIYLKKFQHQDFYVSELLISVASQNHRILQERQKAIELLQNLVQNQSFFSVKKDKNKISNEIMCYIKKKLIKVMKNSERELQPVIIRLMGTMENNSSEKSDEQSQILKSEVPKKHKEEDLGKKFCLKVLLEKEPRLYALSKIQHQSLVSLDIPKIHIQLKVIEDDRDYDDVFKNKMKEMLDKIRSTRVLTGLKEMIANLSNAEATESAIEKVFDELSKRYYESNEDKSQVMNLKRQVFDTFKEKIERMQNEYAKHSQTMLENFLLDDEKKVLLIQGDAGSGKTLLLRIIEQNLWREYNGLQIKNKENRKSRIPLRISLAEVRSLEKAVEEFLTQNGCDYEGIQEIKNSPVIILFDGYDELPQSVNLYNKNKLEMWTDVKVVFTSRREAIHALKNDYLLSFCPGTDIKQVLSYVILPVDDSQRKEYFAKQAEENRHEIGVLKQNVTVLRQDKENNNHDVVIKAIENEIKDLEKFISYNQFEEKVQEFKEILASPFMLKILVQTIPKFTTNNINRSELYRLFTTMHFEREQEKVLKNHKVPPKTNLMESFYQYSKDLAVNMFIRGVASIHIRTHNYQMSGITEKKKENIWSRFFDTHDPLTKLARHGAQIVEDDGVVRFLHKSIMEYFAARVFYDEIIEFNPSDPDYDFCFDRGTLVPNDRAVYKFFDDIQASQVTVSTDSLTLFDKKLFEVFNNPAIKEKYAGSCEKLETHYLLPNLFLAMLLRKDVIQKIYDEGAFSVAAMNVVTILKWIFSRSKVSDHLIGALQLVVGTSKDLSENLTSLLAIYYNIVSTEAQEYKDVYTKLNPTKGIQEMTIFINKDATPIVYFFNQKDHKNQVDYISESYQGNGIWKCHAKFFVYGSQDNVVLIQDPQSGWYLYASSTKLPNDKKNIPQMLTMISPNEAIEPWDWRGLKWILRFDNEKPDSFTLRSMKNPSLQLIGGFKYQKQYTSIFNQSCQADLHLKDTKQQFYPNKSNTSSLLCEPCAHTCHNNFEADLKNSKETQGSCGCRFIGTCAISNGCTNKFGAKTTNVTMFKCKICSTETKSKIICIFCKSHHMTNKPHTNNSFVEVTNAEECDCDCISSRTKLIALSQGKYSEEPEVKENKFQNFIKDLSQRIYVENYGKSNKQFNHHHSIEN